MLVVNELGGHKSDGTAKSGSPGVGIGNCPPSIKNHTDWTFVHNAAQYSTRDLYIFVRKTSDGLVFTLQPQGGSVRVHDSLTLTAYAPNAARYQWRKNGVSIDGATAATYDVPTDAAETATYDVMAWDASGHAGASAPAVVRVNSGATYLIVR